MSSRQGLRAGEASFLVFGNFRFRLPNPRHGPAHFSLPARPPAVHGSTCIYGCPGRPSRRALVTLRYLSLAAAVVTPRAMANVLCVKRREGGVSRAVEGGDSPALHVCHVGRDRLLGGRLPDSHLGHLVEPAADEVDGALEVLHQLRLVPERGRGELVGVVVVR